MEVREMKTRDCTRIFHVVLMWPHLPQSGPHQKSRARNQERKKEKSPAIIWAPKISAHRLNRSGIRTPPPSTQSKFPTRHNPYRRSSERSRSRHLIDPRHPTLCQSRTMSPSIYARRPPYPIHHLVATQPAHSSILARVSFNLSSFVPIRA